MQIDFHFFPQLSRNRNQLTREIIEAGEIEKIGDKEGRKNNEREGNQADARFATLWLGDKCIRRAGCTWDDVVTRTLLCSGVGWLGSSLVKQLLSSVFACFYSHVERTVCRTMLST